MLTSIFTVLATQILLASAQNIRRDPGVYGPALEVAHLYYGQWPTAITVSSSSGRMFSSFPSGLDANNTNNGTNGKFQVAELFNGTEVPFPSVAFNSPPGGQINRTTTPPSSANYQNYFIGVQSVVIDSNDTLWAVDTGRAIDPTSGTLTPGQYGGCKLVGISLSNNTVVRTIVFDPTVCYADSYFNDVRFDLSRGYAYLTDSSGAGRTGLIVVNLNTGNAWRHLTGDARTRPEQQFLPFVWGQPVYGIMNGQASYISFGADGIELSKDGSELYFAPTGGHYLYSIATALLRNQGPTSEIMAQAGVMQLTQKGASDGFALDPNSGNIFMGSAEANAIVSFVPSNSSVATFVRDPTICWMDTLSVANGYLYFTDNQLIFAPQQTYPGTERRQHPYVLYRAPLPGNGTVSSGNSTTSM